MAGPIDLTDRSRIAIEAAAKKGKVTKKSAALIEDIVHESVFGTEHVWEEYRNTKGSIWLAVLATAKEIIELVEGLNKAGVKGDQKKAVVMTIIETVIDEQDIKLKVLGIPIPGAKGILKRYILKYAEKAIDWLVANVLTKKKTKTIAKKTTTK